ncbi:MAG TPA: hypothetical protein VNW97_05635 [Candidatus Saccharimonadales bacterium]|jgi:hypothetical protein|nr:hypothetical protein [Candidatus Saccharimonadales bacterium]
MLSDFQINDLWEQWISAETRSLYFAEMGRRYSLWQNALIWTTLLLASGATVTLISDWLPKEYAWIKPALTALTAALSFLSIVMQNPKKYADCADLHFKWNRLAGEYKTLWNETYADDSAAILARLNDKGADLSKTGMWIANKKRMLLKWEDHVLRQHGVPAA